MSRNSMFPTQGYIPGPSSLSHACSAAASSPTSGVLRDPEDGVWVQQSSLLPPTRLQLAQLTALPSGLLNRSDQSGRKNRQKGVRLAREGQIVSQTFDAFGRRPYPTNGLSLTQSVQVELTFTVQNWLTSSATSGIPSFQSAYFALTAFSGAAALVTVFDQYRIDQVETWIEFQAPNGTSAFPDLITAVDLDDANVPTSVGQVQDKLGALSGIGPGGHYHRFRPHTAVAIYSGAFTSFANEEAQWIDSASSGVQHYGLKGAVVSNGGIFATNLVIRAVVSFRSPAIN